MLEIQRYNFFSLLKKIVSLHFEKNKDMISRNSIRIKVMQAIYEYHLSSEKSMGTVEMNLMQTFDSIYKLYLQLLASFGALTHIAEHIIETKKQKLLPTETDLHPNYKFVNNLFVKKIEENTSLQRALRNHHVSWSNDLDMLFIKKVYYQLSNTPIFVNYMQNHEQSFEEDKAFIIEVIEKFLLGNEDICNYLGEKRLHWHLDYNDVVILVYNTLKSYTKNQKAEKPLPPLFKTNEIDISEDRQFGIDLFWKTIAHDDEYDLIVEQKLRHWEKDRIAYIDSILLKMAICEFCEFPTIPLRVTLNEYIEISKYYSTPKSSHFVNGMLDSILLDLKKEKKVNKQGRGLMG